MKTEWPPLTLKTSLFALGLLAWSIASAPAQVSHVYSARKSSSSGSTWDPPCWWISAGGSEYSKSKSGRR